MVQPRKMSLRTMRNGTRYSGNRTARTNNSRKPISIVFLTPNGLERAQKRRPRTGPSQARTIDGCQRSAQSYPAQIAISARCWILHALHAPCFALRDARLSAGDSAVRESVNGAFIHVASAAQDRAGSPARTSYSGRAGTDFLMRLIAQHGLSGAARVLRALAEELEQVSRCQL